MAEIHIPFNVWSKQRLKKGKKTATSRRTKYGEPEDTFIVGEQKFQITNVLYLPLRLIANRYYLEEGAKSEEEFIEIWKGIHPIRGWNPDQKVYIHFFKEIKDWVRDEDDGENRL
jgi:hypothetical protein